MANILTPLPSCAGSAKALARNSIGFHITAAAVVLALLLFAASQARAQTPAKPATKSAAKSSTRSAASRKPAAAAASTGSDALEKQLEQLSRALRDSPNATTYAALSAYAARNAKNETGARAALALGYYDLMREKPDLALGWMRKAVGEKLLRDYVLYWQAQASIALGQKEAALEQLQSILRDFPNSAITEQTVTSLAQTAIAIGKSGDALAALDAYPSTSAKPALLLLRAQAHEKILAAKAEKPLAAAADYLDLYYRFPLNDEAKVAGQQIPGLLSALGESFPGVPLQTQMARAEAFYLAKRWREAATEYAGLLPKLSGMDHQRADLRIVQCEVELGGKLDQLGEIPLSDPELDAERIFSIAQAHRGLKLEPQLLEDVDQLVKRYPQSSWTAEALFGAGNFYWVNLDRERAADFYRRSLDISPDGKKRAKRRVAFGMDRVSGSQTRSRGYVGSLHSAVSDVELRTGCALLAWAFLRALRKFGARAKFLSGRRQSISADLFWSEGRGTIAAGTGRHRRFACARRRFAIDDPCCAARARARSAGGASGGGAASPCALSQ